MAKYYQDDQNSSPDSLPRLEALKAGILVLLGFDTESRIRSNGSDAVVLRNGQITYSNEEDLFIDIRRPTNKEKES